MTNALLWYILQGLWGKRQATKDKHDVAPRMLTLAPGAGAPHKDQVNNKNQKSHNSL